MPTRLERLRDAMRTAGLPALLVTKPEHYYYLAGFTGSACVLVVTDTRQQLITDFRYVLQSGDESPDWELVQVEETVPATVRAALSALGMPQVGFEQDDLTVSLYHAFGGGDAELPYTLIPAPPLLETLRLVKEPDELAAIRAATRLTDDAYAHLLTKVAPGVTEQDLALEAEWFMRARGGTAAFDIIVATGARGALPHAQPGPRPLRPGDLVVVDMGAKLHHYCADMTRTFAVCEATPIGQEIYRVCLEAQLAGVQGIRAGMSGRAADTLVRYIIVAAGYGQHFGHGTGHGVGLEIHEAPRVSRVNETPMPAGTIITIEPGIYLPDVAGVRIEDLCLLTDSGVDILTDTPKPPEVPVVG